jgi:uncharacterized membrane protein YdfJ with MMPL/SSD domain
VVVDATIVRALLVPATMRLMGRWNWWVPAWVVGVQRRLSPGPGHSIPRSFHQRQKERRD